MTLFSALALLLFNASSVFAQNNPDKPINFDGYSLTDSLEYSAKSIEYIFKTREVMLNRNANLRYMGRLLKSNSVKYYQNYDYIDAQGIADSTGKLVDTPEFTDKDGEKIAGDDIKYNIKTEEGLVDKGRTKYDTGYMTAATIKKVSDDTLFVANGTYTTCDKEDPDFYFYGQKMKFILNDKLIIKPVVAYIQNIPLMWFPFYVFPIAKGRQSGFLTPRYGSSRIDGRYFSNLGYYFAPSDYFDYRVAGTLRERNGWLVNNWFNYNKRDVLSGSVYASFEDETRKGTKQWKLSGNHSQDLSPTMKISGRIDLQSSQFSKNNSPNYFQRMNRNVNSNISLTKRWKESGNNLQAYISNSKNLDTSNRTTVFPSISFSMPNRLMFGKEKSTEKPRKYTYKSSDVKEEDDSRWYESIYYNFNTRYQNSEKKDTSTQNTKNLSMSSSITGSNKLLGWLTANPSLSLNENFYSLDDSLDYRRTDQVTMGLSLNTKIYGTIAPGIKNVIGIRHVLTPSISYNYGTNRKYEGNSTDVFYRLDQNDEKDSKTSSLSFSLRNLFQAKTLSGDQEKKFDLFTVDFSGGINFEDEKKPVRPLQTTFDIKPLKTIQIRLSSTHSFYNNQDKFIMSPYLDDVGISTNIGLSDQMSGLMGTSSRVNANKNMGRDMFDTDIDEADKTSGVQKKEKSSLPFKLSFSHYYKISRRSSSSGGNEYTTTHNIKPNLSFSPTRNFTINYDMYYDIRAKSLNYHRVVIKRDLHCWEAYLSWVPSGVQEGFYFKVNIKDLPDVKLEKRRGVSRFSG